MLHMNRSVGSDNRTVGSPTNRYRLSREQFFLVLLGGYLLLMFLSGGSAREDLARLTLPRAGGLVVMLAIVWRGHIKGLHEQRFILGVLAAVTIGIALQLVPLPPSLWQGLPGRDLVTQIDRLVGLGQIWRPFSLDPERTWNALFGMVPPLVVALLASQMGSGHLIRLLGIFLVLIALSALVGVLQLCYPNTAMLFPYGIELATGAGGLFANRNHQALVLAMAIPMIATAWRLSDPRKAVARTALIAFTVAILPLILVTGSRAGLVLGALALASVPLLLEVRLPGGRGRSPGTWWQAAPLVLLAVLLSAAILSPRAEAVKRFLAGGGNDGWRLGIARIVGGESWRFFPWGSGTGSFARIYQVYEGNATLIATYVNHVHNDYVEVLFTAGLPGVAVLAVVVFDWLRSIWVLAARRSSLSPADRSLALLGVILLLLIGLASLVDYPVRTPAGACLMIAAWIWSRRAHAPSGSTR